MLPAPLPDIFGNYAIAGIAEVISPDPVAWLPQTPGWRILGAVILVLLLRWSLKRYRDWRRNRYRRLALKELGRLHGSIGKAAHTHRSTSPNTISSEPKTAETSASMWPRQMWSIACR